MLFICSQEAGVSATLGGAGILAPSSSQEKATCYARKSSVSIKTSGEDPGNCLVGSCPRSEGRGKFSLASETDQYSFCSVTSHHQMRPPVHGWPCFLKCNRYWSVSDAFATMKKSDEIPKWLLIHFTCSLRPKYWNLVYWMPSID